MAAAFLLTMTVGVTTVFAQSALDGAWEVTAASFNGEEAENIQPSLYLFREGYYSILSDNNDGPRPLLEEGESRSTLSDEKLREIVLPITANSGRFEVDGSSLTTTPMVAINTNFMRGGSATYEFSVSGNVLTLAFVGFDRHITLKRLD